MSVEHLFSQLNIDDKKTYNVISIDIGVCNLGISCSIITEDFNLEEIVWIDLVNLTEFSHNAVKREDCKLPHSRTFSDWMEHFFQEYKHFFDVCDFVIVERQPPTGFVVVEQFIFNRFRNKCHLVSPVNYHSFFNMRDLDYEHRKIKSETIGMRFIQDDDLLRQIEFYNRKHDITDSICMLIYWLDKRQKIHIKQQKIDYANTLCFKGVNINKWLEQFRYNL